LKPLWQEFVNTEESLNH